MRRLAAAAVVALALSIAACDRTGEPDCIEVPDAATPGATVCVTPSD